MRLTYTNAAFTYYGVSMPGVPVRLDDEMVIVDGPQRWLFYVALDRGRTRSPARLDHGVAIRHHMDVVDGFGIAQNRSDSGPPSWIGEPPR
jgi:hypothetical protein